MISVKAFLLPLAFASFELAPALAQDAQVIVSSRSGDRLSAKPPIAWEAAGDSARAGFRLDASRKYQTIAGFGASFLEAGLICLNSLSADQQETVLETLFHPVRGAGFSAMKTPLAGTDFMCAGPWYTYNDTPGDVRMEHFTIARDLGTNGLVRYIQRARRYGQFVLQAPMDYPPDWMLFDVGRNQDVDPRYFDALALYYLRYVRAYQEQGIFIDYLSLFNEPGVYTKIPYSKIRDLLKNHVGPLFTRESVKTRLQLSEAPGRPEAARNYPIVLDDPEARRYVANLPYHGYDLHSFEPIAALHERYPDLPTWMTELCYAYEAGTPRSMTLPRVDFEDGEFWGDQIFSDLEASASAWIYWNMILDQQGGPWLVSPIHGNPADNVQHPVVIIDRERKEVKYTGLFYYLAHFSKFVRPGTVRIGVTGAVAQVRCLAFQAPDGRQIAELLNHRSIEVQLDLRSGDHALRLRLPAHSITTCLWRP